MLITKAPPLVCVLMATHNGQQFLVEQLTSIANQTHTNWHLVVSDDGSTDATQDILRKFQQQWGTTRVQIRQGPKQGFCANFLSMACDSTLRADFYAFCDQDDVWLDDKIERAIDYFIKSNQSSLPRAYGSRTKIVDKTLTPLDLSPNFTLPRSFRNALVQSIAGGNTQVFNRATKDLLEQAGRQQVVSHDWWLYLLVKGAGGVFHYDPVATVLYRQHDSCLIGSNTSSLSRINRLKYVFNGRFKSWNDTNYLALHNVRHLLSKDNQELLDMYGKFRGAQFKDRIRLLEVCGLYRQTWQGTMSLWLATFINKI